MTRRPIRIPQNPVLSLLVVGILTQALILVVRAQVKVAPGIPRVGAQVGDTFPSLTGYDTMGSRKTIPLADNLRTATVLYVFHPDCAYSENVAQAWGLHFADSRGDTTVRKIAVTGDSPAAAASYAARFDWPVELLSLPQLRRTDQEHSLLSKTPWLFVLDSHGVIRRQAHGTELNQLTFLSEVIN